MTQEDEYLFPKEIRDAIQRSIDKDPTYDGPACQSPDFLNEVFKASGLSKKEIQELYKSIGRHDLAAELDNEEF